MAKLKSKLRRGATRGIFPVVGVGASAGGFEAFKKALEAQAWLAAIIESSDDAITSIDRAGQIISWNKAAGQLYGYAAAEALGRPISMLVPADKSAELRRLLKLRRRGQKIVGHETVRTTKDGKRLNVSMTISPIRDATGRLIGSSAFVRDITARKQAEFKLHESEDRFEQMAANVGEVFWLAKANLRQMLYISPAFEIIWGHSREKLYANPQLWLESVHPDDQRIARAAFIRNRTTTAPLDAEYRIQRPDGTIRWIQDRGGPVRDKTGRIYRIAGVARDITRQKQAEAALRESEARFRVLFDEANDGLLLADGQTKRFLLANRQIQKWLGYSAAELVKMWIRDIHPVANLPHIIKDFERQSRQEISLVQNVPMRRKDGTVFYADVNSARITLQGRLYQLGIFRDVTERRRLEAEIQQISETEKQRLGHDLHDGLSQQLIAVRYIASELESALREHARPEAATAAKIVRELSQASKQIHDIARGLCPIELKNWDIVSALEELAAATTDRFQITSRVVGPRQIHWADLDTARQLYRIAQEAITNAGKHSHGQHITIRLVKQPHRIILTVKDDGRGIPARRRGGTGLGLQVMQYRANLINAELTIARGPGGGTLVTCVLPTPKPQRRSS